MKISYKNKPLDFFNIPSGFNIFKSKIFIIVITTVFALPLLSVPFLAKDYGFFLIHLFLTIFSLIGYSLLPLSFNTRKLATSKKTYSKSNLFLLTGFCAFLFSQLYGSLHLLLGGNQLPYSLETEVFSLILALILLLYSFVSRFNSVNIVLDLKEDELEIKYNPASYEIFKTENEVSQQTLKFKEILNHRKNSKGIVLDSNRAAQTLLIPRRAFSSDKDFDRFYEKATNSKI